MPRPRRKYDEITAHANALARLCVAEKIAHLEINLSDNSAVTWRRFDVPPHRTGVNLVIGDGKTERF